MKKYKYVGDYEEAHRKVKLIPGEIVELPDVPPRLAHWLTPVVEEAPAAPKAVAKAPKTTKPKKKKKQS